MKRFLFVFFSIFLLIIATSFVTIEQRNNQKTDPSVYKLMEVISLWDLLKHEYEPDRDRDATWLDVGFRSKYAMAKKYASLATLETVFGTSVFIRGPHQGEMNFNSTTSFGYYNSDFLDKLQTSITTALKNPLFNKMAKQAYHKHFKSMALSYQNAYYYLNADPESVKELSTTYLQQLNKPAGISSGSFRETFRGYADHKHFSTDAEREAYEAKNPNADWYEEVIAPAFWLRRSIDGTAEQLIDLLDRTIMEMEK